MTVGITELPPEGMQLGGVALAGDAERGTKTTEGLSLLFTTAGITVQGPQPQIERLLVWSGLDSASCREKIALPDGRNAAVMELTSGGQSIRFLLPMDAVTPGQAAYLDQALPAWLARYKGSVAPVPPTPRSSTSAPSPARSNGGSTSPGGRHSGDAGRTGAVAPMGTEAPPTAASRELTPAEAAAAAAGAAASANGTTRGLSGPAPGSTSGSTPTSGSPGAVSPTDAGSAATRPDPAGSSFVARSTTGPPPPPAPAAAPPPGPPPPPAGAPVGGPPVGTAGWDLPAGAAPAAAPAAGAAAFPPLGGELTSEDPTKKPRGWRKNRPGAPSDATPETAASDFFAPTRPPAEPPADPVPLALTGALPPPPADNLAAPGTRGPMVWKPPIDPLTGEPAWDQSAAPADSPPKKRRWHRGAKDSAVAAAGASAAAIASTAGSDVAPPGPVPPPGPGFNLPAPAPESAPARRSNRALLTVLLVVLLVVIGGIAYFAVKKNSNSSPTTVAIRPVSPRAADVALAASINLRLADLPSGWSRSPSTVQSLVPVAPAAAQVQAERGLSSCLSQPYALVAGLFGHAVVPGSAGAGSPIFQDGTDAGIQMASTTTVMGTVAGAQVLAAPFANPSFVSCYGNYQTALASAASPGSSATVQTVTLPVPAGVRTFAYLTTFTGPGGRTEVQGDAFSFAGRTEVRLTPMTNGPAVPQSAFASAYDGVTGRLALAVNK